MRTTIVSIGMSLSTGVLVPSVSAGIAPRLYLHAVRPDVASPSDGRVTGRSHSGGVGGRVSPSSPASTTGAAPPLELLHAASGESAKSPTGRSASAKRREDRMPAF